MIDEEERRVRSCFVEYAIPFYHVFYQTSTMDGPRPMGSPTRPLAISVAQEMPTWKHWRILNKRSSQLQLALRCKHTTWKEAELLPVPAQGP